MDIYWKTATGDELRIADADTEHPCLQTTDRAFGWKDINPTEYPRQLFGLCVSLLGALDEMEMLDHPAIVDCGIQAVEVSLPEDDPVWMQEVEGEPV